MTIIEKLQTFLSIPATSQRSEFDENEFTLLNDEKEDIGSYSLEEGNLISFSLHPLEEESLPTLNKNKILEKGEQFFKAFNPNLNDFQLSSLLELDESFMVVYEKKETMYDLFLPGTGFVVTINKAGQVTHYNYSNESYSIQYPEQIIPESEALKQYIDQLDFELVIQKFDRATYKNGDDTYRFSYQVIEQVMEIPVDGQEGSSIREEFNIEETPINKLVPLKKSIYEMIGMTADYQLIDQKIIDGNRIEIWSTVAVEKESFSYEMEEAEEQIIKLCFEEHSGNLIKITSHESVSYSKEKISYEEAKEKALQFLFQLYPNADQYFKLEKQEQDIFDIELEENEDDLVEVDNIEDHLELEEDYEDFEDDFELLEETYEFYFHYYYKDVRVGQHASVITVGKETGKITFLALEVPKEQDLNEVKEGTVISIERAKTIYKESLKMELAFLMAYDENGQVHYNLAYVPAFPATIGHVKAIDALTGEAMFVDVGDAMFF
ncbi:hypothetical protein BTS2_0112 [Bacillus sp. TS-2]|nr:hypothetical protein BTS2_0112 [Bacillus sp. TS-2]